MTTGIIASDAVYPTSAGINALVYDSRGGVATFPFGALTTILATLWGAESFLVPSEPHFSYTGNRARSFSDDYYYRIQINPPTLNLGALANNLVRTVYVWNGHIELASVVLNSIGGTIAGVSYTGPSLPTTYKPNQSDAYVVSITTQGPAVITGAYTFTWSTGEAVPLDVTGIRVVAWSYRPDWQSKVLERLAFQTDVLPAWSGAAQRRAGRIAPRRSFSFASAVERQERRQMETTLFQWSSQIWALPIWPDGQALAAALAAGSSSIACVTDNRDFVVGGLAMLLTDGVSFELVQVGAIAPGLLGLLAGTTTADNWPVGTRLYPVRQARLLAYPRLLRDSGVAATAGVDFTIVEPCDWPAASGLPTYRGAPVLEDSPDAAAGQDASYQREAIIIDNSTGAIEVDDRAGVGFPHFSHAWWLRGAAARSAFRSLMYLLKGRCTEIWVPSYQLDISIKADIGPSASVLTIENIGYSVYTDAVQNRQDIRIELASGTVYYRRIAAATPLSSALEQISIDSALSSSTVAAASIRRVSFLTLCRLAADTVEIQHETALDGLAVATTPFQAVQHAI